MTALVAVLGPSSTGMRRVSDGQSGGEEYRYRDPTGGVHILARPRPAPGELTTATVDGVEVVADAALYYQQELVQRLRGRGITPTGSSAAALLGAAYLAWGDGMASRLEGDIAAVVWDPRRRRLLAVRDFLGRRPLYLARLSDGGLALSSSVAALLSLPACPSTLSLPAIAGVAAGLPESPWDTAYDAITVLPAGRTLVVEVDAEGRVTRVRMERHWTPPTFESGGGAPFDEAAAELRHLIREAVAERLDPEGPTAVWLSGGWDSPTVYGAGQAVLSEGRAGNAAGLRAASMTYPPGDPGREDDLIEQVVRFWDGRNGLHWCDSAAIPLFGEAEREAVARELPYAHPYALWTRGLAAVTAASGARIALDGSGGDQLFQLSPVYLADLLRGGRWMAARREWLARDMGGLGWRRFFRYAVLPLTPVPLVRLAELARGGRPLRGIRGWPLPPWIRADFAAAHDLGSRQEPVLPRRRGESFGSLETRWFFESSYSPTVLVAQGADARQAGVELRSPLFDGRVVQYASRRPREERSDRGQTKQLLRAAARGLVPDAVLAPRRSRTGTTEGYYRQRLLRELPGLARRVLPLSALADLGIAEPSAFAGAVQRSMQRGVQEMDVAIFYTLHTELWLRARS